MGRAADESGTRVPHLQRRQGTYHLRMRVPDDLRSRMGLREVRRSLHVHTFSQARPLALKYAARMLEVFEMVRATELPKDRITAMIVDRFRDLERQADAGYRYTTHDRYRERDYAAHLAEEAIIDLDGQRETGDFRYPVVGEAQHVLAVAGLRHSDLSPAALDDLHDGLARALAERERLVIHRLHERLLPYEIADGLFRRTGAHTPPVVSAPTLLEPICGPSVDDAVETYLSQGKKDWTPKTWAGRTRQLEYLRQHLGPETPLASITPQHIVGYRDALRRLRARSGSSGRETFLERQTDNEQARVSHTTVQNLFNPCRAFFTWAKGQQGYIAINPAEDVRLPRVKKPKGGKSRRPFTTAELEQLFSAPVFTGMKSAARRFEAGKLVIKNAYYWIPILGFYTGARLGELVQLHLSDIKLDDPVPHILITEEGSAERGSGHEKSVKSHAGVRRVPIHSDVMKLGFASFVEKRSADKRQHKRLFWEIPFGADGQASTVFSKWFARLLDKAELNDPALVFHSFRHAAEDAFRNAMQPQYVIDRIIGHSGGNVSDSYGEGVSLETAGKAVEAMKLVFRVKGSVKHAQVTD